MSLNYDFDVYSEVPRELFIDTAPAKTSANQVVLFRDPKTVAAFNAAPKKIRKIFCDSRFGPRVSPSRMPKGYFAPSEEDFRTFVFHELEKNLMQQLSEGELEETLNSKPKKAKRYCFAKRLKKSTKSADIELRQEFNVKEFIEAATSAVSFEIPEEIVENLKRPIGSLSIKDGMVTFFAALAPRLFILFYAFIYAMTQVSAFA